MPRRWRSSRLSVRHDSIGGEAASGALKRTEPGCCSDVAEPDAAAHGRRLHPRASRRPRPQGGELHEVGSGGLVTRRRRSCCRRDRARRRRSSRGDSAAAEPGLPSSPAPSAIALFQKRSTASRDGAWKLTDTPLPRRGGLAIERARDEEACFVRGAQRRSPRRSCRVNAEFAQYCIVEGCGLRDVAHAERYVTQDGGHGRCDGSASATGNSTRSYSSVSASSMPITGMRRMRSSAADGLPNAPNPREHRAGDRVLRQHDIAAHVSIAAYSWFLVTRSVCAVLSLRTSKMTTGSRTTVASLAIGEHTTKPSEYRKPLGGFDLQVAAKETTWRAAQADRRSRWRGCAGSSTCAAVPPGHRHEAGTRRTRSAAPAGASQARNCSRVIGLGHGRVAYASVARWISGHYGGCAPWPWFPPSRE